MNKEIDTTTQAEGGTCTEDALIAESKNAEDAFSHNSGSFDAGPMRELSHIERIAPADISSEYISRALSGRLCASSTRKANFPPSVKNRLIYTVGSKR